MISVDVSLGDRTYPVLVGPGAAHELASVLPDGATRAATKQMDATAIIDYFAPLKTWLDEQLAGKPVGW